MDIRQQGRNEVRLRQEQEASFAPLCSNLRSLGSKGTAFKKVGLRVTSVVLFDAPAVIRRPENCYPFPLSLRPWMPDHYFVSQYCSFVLRLDGSSATCFALDTGAILMQNCS